MDKREADKLLKRFNAGTITDAEKRRLIAFRRAAFNRKGPGRRPARIAALDGPEPSARPTPRPPAEQRQTRLFDVQAPRVTEQGTPAEPEKKPETDAPEVERIAGLPLLKAAIVSESTEPNNEESGPSREEQAETAEAEILEWFHNLDFNEAAKKYAEWCYEQPELEFLPEFIRGQLIFGLVQPATVVCLDKYLPKSVSSDTVPPELVALTPGVVIVGRRAFAYYKKKKAAEEEEKKAKQGTANVGTK